MEGLQDTSSNYPPVPKLEVHKSSKYITDANYLHDSSLSADTLSDSEIQSDTQIDIAQMQFSLGGGKNSKWSCFYRFPAINQAKWYCDGIRCHSIVFVPMKKIILHGFAVFKAKEGQPFDLEYKVTAGKVG